MEIFITQEISHEIAAKLDFVASCNAAMNEYFAGRKYGTDIDELIISVLCMSPKFEQFFSRKRRPMYHIDPKTYIHKGVQVHRPGKCFTYELRLDFSKYMQEQNTRTLFFSDIINSLPVIKRVEKVKDFNLEQFSVDVEEFFRLHSS